jgi:hypothetical protein
MSVSSTSTIAADEKKDRLQMEYFAKSESAINTISTMMGFANTDRLMERNKENPDNEKIDELSGAIIVMGHERQEIYGGNADVMRSVEERYGPIIRERLKNA